MGLDLEWDKCILQAEALGPGGLCEAELKTWKDTHTPMPGTWVCHLAWEKGWDRWNETKNSEIIQEGPKCTPVYRREAERDSTQNWEGQKQLKCSLTEEWIKRWYIHQYDRILLSHKKEWNNAICSNMDGPSDYHIKWSMRQRETNITWYHLHVESKKWYKWTHLQNKQIQT